MSARDGRPGRALFIGAVAAAMSLPACSSPEESAAAGGPTGAPSGTAGTAPADPIPQPVVDDLPVAPEEARVDLAMPTFSDPTIDNPLFPVSEQESVLLVGEVDGQAFRTEVTLLPYTRVLEWNGQLVETAVSQYVAFLDGRIHEVAYDLYAQDDTGAVWYFGEDVLNFADGAIVDTHGTWFAGVDGPAAMIMPADPAVGDVYRPENIPGLVFEEVTVRRVDGRVDGPLGPVNGALTVEELHMDGTVEEKTFAPGYGEFLTSGGGDTEAVAIVIPADRAGTETPADLAALAEGALATLDAVQAGSWPAAASATAEVSGAWSTVSDGDVPVLVRPVGSEAVDRLATAVAGQDMAAASQAAIDVARVAFDLQLRHRPPVEVDLARFDLWLAQIGLDASAEAMSDVSGDYFALDYVRDRIGSALDAESALLVNTNLEELISAIGDGDLSVVTQVAADFRDALPEVKVAG